MNLMFISKHTDRIKQLHLYTSCKDLAMVAKTLAEHRCMLKPVRVDQPDQQGSFGVGP